jgi:hypothetical protein
MILRYMRFILGPALGWALLAGSAFVGIGGMGLQGTSDKEINVLWKTGAIITVISFAVAFLLFARRPRRADSLVNHS